MGQLSLDSEQFSLDPRVIAAVEAAGYTEPPQSNSKPSPLCSKGETPWAWLRTGTGKSGCFRPAYPAASDCGHLV